MLYKLTVWIVGLECVLIKRSEDGNLERKKSNDMEILEIIAFGADTSLFPGQDIVE